MSFRRSRMASFRETRDIPILFFSSYIRRVTLQSNAKSSSPSFYSSYRFLESSFLIRPRANRALWNEIDCREKTASAICWMEEKCRRKNRHHPDGGENWNVIILAEWAQHIPSYAERIWQVNRGTLSGGSTLRNSMNVVFSPVPTFGWLNISRSIPNRRRGGGCIIHVIWNWGSIILDEAAVVQSWKMIWIEKGELLLGYLFAGFKTRRKSECWLPR